MDALEGGSGVLNQTALVHAPFFFTNSRVQMTSRVQTAPRDQ